MLSSHLRPVMARALTALERGQGGEAATVLAPLLRSPALRRPDELAVRCALAEAWLLQEDIDQASAILGRPPDVLREPIEPERLSALWRLHGRVAFARGDQSRAIALLARALKQAELAHDSREIGLAHYELGFCYGHVGETAIIQEHVAKAASALHAAGDRRYLSLVHTLSGVSLAQNGRYEDAMGALRQAERLADAARADDVLGTVYVNQANVAVLRHRYEQALGLGERGVSLHEHGGSPHRLAIALATLGQICVRLGRLERAEQVLHRALEVRGSIQFHETTGAVFDTLAQIHLIRGDFDRADEYLRQAGEAYGGYGRHAGRWYEWSIRILSARLAVRREAGDAALSMADEIAGTPGVPPVYWLQAGLIGVEALVAAGRMAEADERLSHVSDRLVPGTNPGIWGEYLRLRGNLHERAGRATEAYHDFAQSASVFEVLGERYQAALSALALGGLAARAGARSLADRHLKQAVGVFEALGAAPDLEVARVSQALPPAAGTSEYIGYSVDADDVMVRRLVDAAVLPDLLAWETASAMLETCGADATVIFTRPAGGDLRLNAYAGCEADAARAIAQAVGRQTADGVRSVLVEPLGHEHDDPRIAAIVSALPLGYPLLRRVRMIASVARQGFDLCGAREHRVVRADRTEDSTLEPLLPGFVCASAAMSRVADQIRRLQGNDLTVLITGESGTGKDLIARAIHAGSRRQGAMFLPFNCTTTTRELADSQLFGHRRGSFTGAVSDQPGLVRSVPGGTLFLDEIGDLPLDIQPKLLRFLDQGEIMPVGETRPQQVDVRIIAATNADLEQRVAEGKFREDLYYRLSVIRIHVPPLRDRCEEIPHLSALFLREACERLGTADVHLSSETLELFAQYGWPGNVRQLKNEIHRAVTMSGADGPIEPGHLSPELGGLGTTPGHESAIRSPLRLPTLAAEVERLERDLIQSSLARSSGNISETARTLGLTRRGLYLKLRRLGLETRMVDTQ